MKAMVNTMVKRSMFVFSSFEVEPLQDGEMYY